MENGSMRPLALVTGASSGIGYELARQCAEHGTTGRELGKAVRQSELNAEPLGKMDPRSERMLERLRVAKGREFDALYLQSQKDAHEEAISLYRSYAEEGGDAVLRSFAARTLPVLEHHLERIESIAATRH